MRINSKRLYFFTSLLVAMSGGLLTSCASDEGASAGLPAGEYPMIFQGQVLHQPLTRSTSGGSWNGTESVAIKVGEEIKTYAADTYGALTASDVPFYWESKTATVGLLSWFPYDEAVGVPVSFSVQENQHENDGYQKSDFLRAKGNISFTDVEKVLDFYHLPAKVLLNLKAGEGAEVADIKNARISLVNMALTSGVLDMETGEVRSAVGESVITPCRLNDEEVTSGYQQTMQALIVPQQMQGKAFVKVTTGDTDAYYIPSGTTEANLQAGYLYVYNITVNHQGALEVELAVSSPTWGAGGEEQSVVSRTCYTATDIKPGDFFYRTADGEDWLVSDGGLRELNHATGEKTWVTPEKLPNEFEDGRVYLGVVFQADPRRMSATEKAKGWTHGYVMALSNANDKCTWGTMNVNENTTDAAGGMDYFADATRNNLMYNDIDGYAKQVYINENKLAGVANPDATVYDVFYYAGQYGTGASAGYAPPGIQTGKTSGWYAPSIGQWWDILENLGDANGLMKYRTDASGSTITLKTENGIQMSTRIVGKLNERIAASAVGISPFVTGVHYWSSSEKDKDTARRILFDTSGTNNYSLRFGDNAKNNASTAIRSVLAF